MRRVLLIECAGNGVLFVNGQFMGPMEREGQAFPCGKNEEIYIQFFPFGESMPLTAKLLIRDGGVAVLEPQENCFALLWPGGIIQLELRIQGQAQEMEEEKRIAPNTLLRYLGMRLSDDERARLLLMQQDMRGMPDLTEYHAVVPMRFAPIDMGERFDMQAGVVRRIAPNVACVDTALAATALNGQGRRLIERIEIVRT